MQMLAHYKMIEIESKIMENIPEKYFEDLLLAKCFVFAVQTASGESFG